MDSTGAVVETVNSPDELVKNQKDRNEAFVCAPNTVSNKDYVNNTFKVIYSNCVDSIESFVTKYDAIDDDVVALD